MPIGELKDSAEALARGDGKGKARYAPFFYWKDNDTKTLFFLTPVQETKEVLLHRFVRKFITDDKGKRKEIYMTLMCRKDKAWLHESGGKCQLCDEINHKAESRIIALAVELEPQFDEKKRITGVDIQMVKRVTADGTEMEFPQVGLVVQSVNLFFGILRAFAQKRDIDETSWEITREGGGLDTKYVFYPIEHMPDLEPIKQYIPELKDVMENLGSLEAYEKSLDGVRSEDQVRYDKDEKKSTPTADPNDLFENLKQKLAAEASK